MRIETIVARLVREPFSLSIADVRKLTIHQLLYIYGHETDEQGILVPMFHGEEPAAPDPRETRIRQWMLNHGLSRREAEVWWKESQEVQERRAAWEIDAEKRMASCVDTFVRTRHAASQSVSDEEMQDERDRIGEELAADWLTQLATMRKEQVARRGFKGRAW